MNTKKILQGMGTTLGWGAFNSGIGALINTVGAGFLSMGKNPSVGHYPRDTALVGAVGHGALSTFVMSMYLIKTGNVKLAGDDVIGVLGWSTVINPIITIAGVNLGYGILHDTDLISESLPNLLMDAGVGYSFTAVGVLMLMVAGVVVTGLGYGAFVMGDSLLNLLCELRECLRRPPINQVIPATDRVEIDRVEIVIEDLQEYKAPASFSLSSLSSFSEIDVKEIASAPLPESDEYHVRYSMRANSI